MKVKTYLLSDLLPHEKIKMQIQIAKWHFAAWGKYTPNLSLQDWINKALSGSDQDKVTIIACDVQKKILIGSVSLKKQNMDNFFPQYTPWISGLYINKAYRGIKISVLLIMKLLDLALAQDISNVYLFTHRLALKSYYLKFGWELIKPLNKNNYTYKDKPILLFKGETNILLYCVNRYLEASKIIFIKDKDEFIIPF